jgi:hypothetical protein
MFEQKVACVVFIILGSYQVFWSFVVSANGLWSKVLFKAIPFFTGSYMLLFGLKTIGWL